MTTYATSAPCGEVGGHRTRHPRKPPQFAAVLVTEQERFSLPESGIASILDDNIC